MAMKKSPKTQNKGPAVVDTYEEEIEYTCPVRGKVKQKVKVQRYESAQAKHVDEIRTSNSLSEKLDLQYSGLLLSDDSVDESGDA